MDPKVGGKQHKTLKNTDDKFIVLLSSKMKDHDPPADPVDQDADEVNSNAVSEHENDRDPPAEDEVKYNVSEHEILQETLALLTIKCERASRTEDELNALSSSSSLLLGSVLEGLAKSQREYVRFLEMRKGAVANALEKQEHALKNKSRGKDRSSAGRKVLGRVVSLRHKLARKSAHSECLHGLWDIYIGSRFDKEIETETEQERRRVYSDTFWLSTRIMDLEKMVDCMGADAPIVFKKALKDGRDYLWLKIAGKTPTAAVTNPTDLLSSNVLCSSV